MRMEDRVLLAATRQDFTPAHQAAVAAAARESSLDWERLAAAAHRHGVGPLVGLNLRRCEARLPPAVAAAFEQAILENTAYKLRETARLHGALHALREAGYEAMLLKGAALDRQVYRQSWYTVSRDLDLAVRPLPGRDPGEEGRAVRRTLCLSGIECDLDAHHDVTMSGVLPVPFERIWQDARPLQVDGIDALVMSPEDLLLSLTVNACRKRYFRLKSLLDLAETVRHLAVPEAGLDWDVLAEKARAWSCGAIAYTALAAADATLGCGLPGGTLARFATASGLSGTHRRALDRLIAALLARGSLVRGQLLGGNPRGRLLGRSLQGSLLLVYLSLRPGQLARSLAGALAHLPPELRNRRSAAPALAPPV
jgi:hypothetical protein